MLTEERYNKILEMLEEKTIVTVSEITEALDSSDATSRRDINALSKLGKIKKVRGGASKLEEGIYNIAEYDTYTRENINKKQKDVIGKYAASLIEDNDCIYIDAGTTTEPMLKYISAKNVLIVTNDIYHALALSKLGHKVVIVGGIVRSVTGAIVGGDAIRNVERYNFTKGFFGTNGINIKAGLTTVPEEADIKEIALSKCKNKYVLADGDKFGKMSPVTFAPIEKVRIITDVEPNRAYKEATNIVVV